MRRQPHKQPDTNVGRRMLLLGSVFALITASFLMLAVGGSSSTAPRASGYWLEAGDGGIFTFGAPFEGSAAADATRCPANPPARSMPDGSCWSMAPTADGSGYWILNAYSGVIYPYGDAVSYGEPSDTAAYGGGDDSWPTAIGIVGTPDGKGYWVLEAGPERTWFCRELRRRRQLRR